LTKTGGHIDVVRSTIPHHVNPSAHAGRTAIVRSKDRDEACELVAPFFTAHSLDVVGPAADLRVLLRARSTASITIADLRYGTDVVLRPERIQYYKINIPLRGSSLSALGSVEFESFPGRGAVLPPTEAFTMRWSSDLDLFAVRINTGAIERTIEAVLGYPPDEMVRFTVAFDTTSSAWRRWLRSVAMLQEALDEGAPDLVIRPLEELIIGQLLAAQPHNFTDRLDGSPRPARPLTLRRVIERIEADPASPHTVADLAIVAGTSARSLQAAFAEHFGMGPTAYLRRVRLSRAHQDLQAATPGSGESVADIAYRWGFGHVPRFAAAYRERYSVQPSQTLRS
jgi:AraC-like DNA-binding protein